MGGMVGSERGRWLRTRDKRGGSAPDRLCYSRWVWWWSLVIRWWRWCRCSGPTHAAETARCDTDDAAQLPCCSGRTYSYLQPATTITTGGSLIDSAIPPSPHAYRARLLFGTKFPSACALLYGFRFLHFLPFPLSLPSPTVYYCARHTYRHPDVQHPQVPLDDDLHLPGVVLGNMTVAATALPVNQRGCAAGCWTVWPVFTAACPTPPPPRYGGTGATV